MWLSWAGSSRYKMYLLSGSGHWKKEKFVQKSIMVSDFLFQFKDFFLILKILKAITRQNRIWLDKFYNHPENHRMIKRVWKYQVKVKVGDKNYLPKKPMLKWGSEDMKWVWSLSVLRKRLTAFLFLTLSPIYVTSQNYFVSRLLTFIFSFLLFPQTNLISRSIGGGGNIKVF